MAIEGNFVTASAHTGSQEDVRVDGKQKSMSTIGAARHDDSGCFDCNICLDSAHEPVVTLCGHLYCWACIYKWIRTQSSSSLDEDQPQPNCPVCKANVSLNSLVPLYGPGASNSESDSNSVSVDYGVPRRPPPLFNTLITNNFDQHQQFPRNLFPPPQSQSFHHQQYFPDSYEGYDTMTSSNLRSTAMTSIFYPVIGMFGELVFARIFGTSHMSSFAYPYPYPNPSTLLGNSPRMRRQEMQLEKSLNRVTIFLICCIVLCLLLF